MASKAAVSLLIPTFNEAPNIDPLLERIFAVSELYDYQHEVVFADGASQDATCERIQCWQRDYPVRLLRSAVNKGLSAAVIAAAGQATGEFVVVLDADLSHPPESIPHLLEPIVSGSQDMVIGSRYCPGGDTPDWPLHRRLASRLATLPARLFTNVRDPLAGFFAVKRQRLTAIKNSVRGFKIGLEILVTAEPGFRCAEVPILFRERYYGASKMNGMIVALYLQQLLVLAMRRLLPSR